jgi:hypothetical protein
MCPENHEKRGIERGTRTLGLGHRRLREIGCNDEQR